MIQTSALNSIYQKYHQMTNFYPLLAHGLWAPKLNHTWVDQTQINITTSSLCCFEIKLLGHHFRFEEDSLSCQEYCHDVLSPSSIFPFSEFVVWGKSIFWLDCPLKKKKGFLPKPQRCWILNAGWKGVDLSSKSSSHKQFWLQLIGVY